MRTETIEQTIYSIDDLLLPENSHILDNAIEKYWDTNVNYDDWYNYYTYETVAKMFGIYNFKMYFSGFHSQGDGASFEGRYSYEPNFVSKIKNEFPQWIQLHTIAEELFNLQKKHFYSVVCDIKQIGRYCHSNTMYLNWLDFNNGKNYDIDDELLGIFKDLADEFYRHLDRDYEYLTSKEAIIETFKCNEYEFDEDGSIY